MPLKRLTHSSTKTTEPSKAMKSRVDTKGEFLETSFLNIKDYVNEIDVPSELKDHISVALDDWYEMHKKDVYFWELYELPKRNHYPPVPNRDAVVSVGDACFYIIDYMETLEMPEPMISQLENIIEEIEGNHSTDDFDWIDA